MTVSQNAVQRAVRHQIDLLERNFRAEIRNPEQRVIYDTDRFFVVCIADLYYQPETQWNSRVISIYAPRMAPFQRRFDPQPGQPGYVGARAVFEACVTKGVNYVVTLLYGNVGVAVATALAEFGPLFGVTPVAEEVTSQPRLRTFNFGAVPKGAEPQPQPEEDLEDPPVEHHIRNQCLWTYQWGGLKIHIWTAPCKWRGEAIFRYYLTDDDGEQLYTFPCDCWPTKPTKQQVAHVLLEQGFTLE